MPARPPRPRSPAAAPVAWRAALAAALLLGAVLAFTDLGGRYLWQDEAQTALLGRSVLHRGLPYAGDATGSFSQEQGSEVDRATGLYRWHGWLPFYLVAGSFRLLGESAFAARLPFALMGVGALLAVAALGRRLFADPRAAAASAWALVLMVPSSLYARQCRYYAAAALLATLCTWAYAGLVLRRRGSVALLVLSASLLFHAHFLFVATLLAAMFVHATCYHRAALARVVGAGAVVAVISGPWAVWFAGMRFGERYGQQAASPGHWLRNAGGFVEALARRALPGWVTLALAVALVVLLVRSRRPKPLAPSLDPSLGPAQPSPEPGVSSPAPGVEPAQVRGALALLCLELVLSLLALSVTSPLPFDRYLAPLLPLLALLAGRVALAASDGLHRLVLPALLALAVGAGPLPSLAYELTHAYNGPVRGLVEHLRAHARPGEIAAISYEDLPVKFHVGMPVLAALPGDDVDVASRADWIVLRRHPVSPAEERFIAALRARVDWSRYQAITVPAPDTRWDNREALPDHPFATDPGEPPLVIHRRLP